MLTADLVDARKKDGQLLLRPLDREGREEALALGAAILDAAHAFVGKRREELEETWEEETSAAEPRRFKVAAGLRKLAADACTFEAESAIEPAELRRVLFGLASEARRSRPPPFDRAAVVAEAATSS